MNTVTPNRTLETLELLKLSNSTQAKKSHFYNEIRLHSADIRTQRNMKLTYGRRSVCAYLLFLLDTRRFFSPIIFVLSTLFPIQRERTC